MPNGQEQPTAEAEFVQEAETELTEIVREVEDADRRHGPRPRRPDQDVALLEAELDALELERLDLLDQLDAVIERGEGAEQEVHATAGIEDEAAWMKGARRELDKLIAETWGPHIMGNRAKPDKG